MNSAYHIHRHAVSHGLWFFKSGGIMRCPFVSQESQVYRKIASQLPFWQNLVDIGTL